MDRFAARGTQLDRRRFLKGATWSATALVAAVAVPAAAQEPQAPPRDEAPKNEPDKAPEPKGRRKLVDKNGREYRVCDMCGANMYQDGKVWTCEQCGFSFEE